MDNIIAALLGAAAVAIGFVAYLKSTQKERTARLTAESERLRLDAEREGQNKAKEFELAARSEAIKQREAFEKDFETRTAALNALEQRLAKREDTLDRKLDTLSVKEKTLDDLDAKLNARVKQIAARETELEQTLNLQKDRLLEVAGMSIEQAKELLLKRIEDDCTADAAKLIQRVSDQAQEEAREKSLQITLQAIQRYAAQHTSDHTVSTVQLPSEDMKGRVIGREGRNIRSFENATGVDVIIDDTPGVVEVSCFDPVRRQIAKLSMDRLVQDGRIHPSRIEEVVAIITKEMDEELLKLGKAAAQEANIPNLSRPIIPMLGRLHYRTSYGQNVLRHSLEVAYLTQVMADELGLDGNVGRRAGFLHDIGKAMDHEKEGGHPQIGMEFLRKFNESEAVLNACLAHHGDVPATTPYTALVMAADAMSAARPGARRESLERYIKRLRDLEELAMGFRGVRQAYAIQAGREVRVIVDAQQVDDHNSVKLAHDVARKIETEMQYPGEIKVTTIREIRTVDFAR